MIKDHDAWKRSTRAIDQMKERLVEAQFEEQFQGIGHLAREAFISMAQAVHDPVRHPSEDGTAPSATDAKRMLDSYVAAELAGAAREEARRFARAAVVYADAVTHKRSAIRTDAELVVAAIDGVARIIAILGQVGPPEDPWSGIDVDGRYFAWSGPTLHQLPDRPPVPTPTKIEDALRDAGMTPRFGLIEKLRDHFAKDRLQVFETDRRSWRRALLLRGNGDQVLIVSQASEVKGKPKITSRGWKGVNEAGQTYQAYPGWRYHPTKPPVVVQNEVESDALGEEWADTPAAFPPKDEDQ